MNNMATAHYHFYLNRPAHIYMKWPTVMLRVFVTAPDVTKPDCFVKIAETPSGCELIRFEIDRDYFNDEHWTRDNFLLYLVTNHIDVLSKYDIGYFIDAEAVELPTNFMEAE